MIRRGTLAILLALAASPLSAQSVPSESQHARAGLATLGQCIVAQRGDQVRGFLRNPSASSWYPVTSYRNDDAPCVGFYSVTADEATLRGAVAEAWYLATYPAAPGMTPGTAPTQEEVAGRIVAASEADRPQVIVDEFARCVVATAPSGVDALLRTEQVTSAESQALTALSGSFAPCAFEGQKIAFNAETLRAALAFALASRAMREFAV